MKIYEYIVRMKDQASDKLNRLASNFNQTGSKADRLSGSTDRLGNKLNGVGANANKANNQFNQLNSQWSNSLNLGNMLTRVIGPAALGAALIFGANKASALSRELEQTNITFEVMMGSAAKAHALVSEVTALANVTPFTRTELLDASKLMLNFGIAEAKILPNLKMLGDISGGNANKLHLMTLAFSQSAAAGRLMGQDLLQMINAGFNPLQEISKATGLSMAVLKKKMEDAAISTDMVQAAFSMATSEGGRFFGMMDKQSQTFEGRLSTLQDKAEIFATGLGDKLNEKLSPILDKTISLLDRLVDSPGAVKNESENEIKAIRGLVTETLPLLERFEELKKKGISGMGADEVKEYVNAFRTLSKEIPIGAIRDSKGKIGDFDPQIGKKFIQDQKDQFRWNTYNREKELKQMLHYNQLQIDDEKQTSFTKRTVDGEKLNKLNIERNRIQGLIDEIKSARGNAFAKIDKKEAAGVDKGVFDPLFEEKKKKGKLKNGIDSITGGGKQHVNVTINLQALVAEQNFNTTTVKDAVPEMERTVIEALTRVINSANYAAAQ